MVETPRRLESVDQREGRLKTNVRKLKDAAIAADEDADARVRRNIEEHGA